MSPQIQTTFHSVPYFWSSRGRSLILLFQRTVTNTGCMSANKADSRKVVLSLGAVAHGACNASTLKLEAILGLHETLSQYFSHKQKNTNSVSTNLCDKEVSHKSSHNHLIIIHRWPLCWSFIGLFICYLLICGGITMRFWFFKKISSKVQFCFPTVQISMLH